MTKKTCYIGLMSGTSMDGIDAVAADFSNGSPRLLAAETTPYPDDLSRDLARLVATPGHVDLARLLEIDHRIADCFAAAANALSSRLPDHCSVAAIGSHGQTIHHLPESRWPNTLQLGDPSRIAEQTGITTIANWRRRDMAAGGQGAPLTPVFHCHFIRSSDDTAVLNLGGIANLTLIPGAGSDLPPIGFDTGPANTLLDAWAWEIRRRPFDEDGKLAASGKVHQRLLTRLLKDDYFTNPPPKSTGREHFNRDWLEHRLATLAERPPPEDVAATLVELTIVTIRSAIESHQHSIRPTRLLVCGGGTRNPVMMQRLKSALDPITVQSTASVGIDPDYLEAMAFAWFANQTLAGRKIDTSPFTGATGPRILGGIFQA